MSAILRSINVKAAPAVRPAARLRAKAPARAAPARKAMSVRATGRDLNTSSRPGETLEQTAARRYNESMAVQQRTVVRRLGPLSLCRPPPAVMMVVYEAPRMPNERTHSGQEGWLLLSSPPSRARAAHPRPTHSTVTGPSRRRPSRA